MIIHCNIDGESLSWLPEHDGQPASIGMICAWGGFTIAEISEEVPEGERDEYAQKLVDRYNHHAELVEALGKTAAKLKEYAEADEEANGYGAGCFQRPDEFIESVIAESDALLTKLEASQ